MEIWKNSRFTGRTANAIAGRPQSRTQVLEVQWQDTLSLWPVEHGVLLLTVYRGAGTIKSGEAEHSIGEGDQVYLCEGDEFALQPANRGTSFVVQMHWSPTEIDLQEG